MFFASAAACRAFQSKAMLNPLHGVVGRVSDVPVRVSWCVFR